MNSTTARTAGSPSTNTQGAHFVLRDEGVTETACISESSCRVRFMNLNIDEEKVKDFLTETDQLNDLNLNRSIAMTNDPIGFVTLQPITWLYRYQSAAGNWVSGKMVIDKEIGYYADENGKLINLSHEQDQMTGTWQYPTSNGVVEGWFEFKFLLNESLKSVLVKG